MADTSFKVTQFFVQLDSSKIFSPILFYSISMAVIWLVTPNGLLDKGLDCVTSQETVGPIVK